MSRITTDSYGFSPRRFPPIPLQILEPERILFCTCNVVEITVKDADCEGDWMKHWCARALQYNRNPGGDLTGRIAFGLDAAEFLDGPVCDTSEFTETDWFFEPSEADVTAWLFGKEVPPTPGMAPPPEVGWLLKVTLFFECYRGMVWDSELLKAVPCDPSEETSRIVLRGICYGRQDF